MTKTTILCSAALYTLLHSTTSYYSVSGGKSGLEVKTKVQVYDSLTWKNLYIRVTLNSVPNASTLTSRVNGGDGNLSLSITALTTGEFEDTVNNDALSSGDEINYKLVTGSDSKFESVAFRVISSTLEHSTTSTSIFGAIPVGVNAHTAGTTTYQVISGGGSGYQGTESSAQFTIHYAGTMDKLRVYVSSNDADVTTTVRTRVNGANGNCSVSILATETGEFEDAINSDSLSDEDEIDYQIVLPSGTGSTTIELIQTRFKPSSDDVHIYIAGDQDEVEAIFGGLTKYLSVGGTTDDNTWDDVEANKQMKTRVIDGILKNLFVNVPANPLSTTSTFRTRVNGENGNLSVSVDAAATGFFEDTTNSDELSAGDEINFQGISGANGAEYIGCTIIAVSHEAAEGPTYVYQKLSNVFSLTSIVYLSLSSIFKIKEFIPEIIKITYNTKRNISRIFSFKFGIIAFIEKIISLVYSGVLFFIIEVTWTPYKIHRTGIESTTLRCDWHDADDLTADKYKCQFWVRDESNSTYGPYSGSVTKEGAKEYNATYELDPDETFLLGKYDVKAEVTKYG